MTTLLIWQKFVAVLHRFQLRPDQIFLRSEKPALARFDSIRDQEGVKGCTQYGFEGTTLQVVKKNEIEWLITARIKLTPRGSDDASSSHDGYVVDFTLYFFHLFIAQN